MSENGAQVIFELFDTALAEIAPDVFGLWATTPISSVEAVAFDMTSTTITDAPLWRANLSALIATAHLANGEARLEASQKALSTATDRLNALVILCSGAKTSLAFDVSSAGKELAQPERELLTLLQELQETELPKSFGLDEELVEGWQQTNRQFQTFVEQLLHVVANYAWVETHIQGQILARTAVSWTGDMASVWQKGIDPAQVALHQRTLALALASRDTLIQTFNVAAQGTLKLSVLLTMPGGTVLAFPAVWRFINQVLAESKRHQQIEA